MTEYLKSLYIAAITEKTSFVHKLYASIFVCILIQGILLLLFPNNRNIIVVSIFVFIIFLSRLDIAIEKKKQAQRVRKEKLFYEIFYPEMLQTVLKTSLKIRYNFIQLWPYQGSYFKNIIQVYHEDFALKIVHFKTHINQKPFVKCLFEIPSMLYPFVYLNHNEKLETPFYMFQNHFVYHNHDQSRRIQDLIETMNRCPYILDLEMIFNGQSAMFLCKIEDVVYMQNFKIIDNNFKKHLHHLRYINDVFRYITKTLKEIEDAHRK